ncbi:hypothetical protein [Pseudomonas rossensis]|uniref:hypothetical protein n=1 Tax=Pseudomonas rossensis TaxID=2305471 RepID=UPI0032608C4F
MDIKYNKERPGFEIVGKERANAKGVSTGTMSITVTKNGVSETLKTERIEFWMIGRLTVLQGYFGEGLHVPAVSISGSEALAIGNYPIEGPFSSDSIIAAIFGTLQSGGVGGDAWGEKGKLIITEISSTPERQFIKGEFYFEFETEDGTRVKVQSKPFWAEYKQS